MTFIQIMLCMFEKYTLGLMSFTAAKKDKPKFLPMLQCEQITTNAKICKYAPTRSLL